MQINDVIHGFKVINAREIKDCGGTLYEMVHEKTNAGLCWLKRDDVNMTFSVAFKTIPENDTGVFHILEHSVLNGSRKYPVREPFVELLKSSMQTFLNAMTYPDKTLYPIATRNKKDYRNLMSVYMDAVFHPAIYDNPNIFRQEGWHYEIHQEDETPSYKGVVFNEMKGAFSSVDETVITELNRMLFPDNCYQYVSGGDPVKIPTLTYEQFIAYHQKFYHPSNARFFLDGDLNIEDTLQFINDEYLSEYERLDVNFDIPMQKPTSAAVHVYDYEIAEEDDSSDKTMAALAKIISSYDDVEQNTAWQVLSQILAGSNESPFKKAILAKGLGQDVELNLYDGIQQPWAVIMVRNTSEDKAEEALQTLKDTAEDLVKNGLNHEQILASLNQLQFQYLEKKEPAGIVFAASALSSWTYGGDPALYLSCKDVYDTLRKKTEEGYFEALLKDFLLDFDHLSAVIARPNRKLAKQRLEAEEKELREARDSWGNQIKDRIRENELLDQWQGSPDTREQLDTLPKLSLSDIDPLPMKFVPEVTKLAGAEALIYPKESTGIAYLNLYFSLGGITLDHLPSVRLFSDLLKDLPTRKHNVEELNSLIRRDLGMLNFSSTIQRAPDSELSCIPLFVITSSYLKENQSLAENLITEILTETVFRPDEISVLIRQKLDEYRQTMIMAGHVFAMSRVSAHLSADGVAGEYSGGYAYGQYLKALCENKSGELEQFINDAKMYQEILFVRSRLTVSFSDPEAKPAVEHLIRNFELGDAHRCTVRYPLLNPENEAIIIPAQIAFTAAGINLKAAGGEYDGSWQVMAQILTYGYLWNEVRVKGGAYGTGFNAQPNSTVCSWSYRDPSASGSFRIFTGCGDYIEDMLKDKKDISSFIIGTIAKNEPLLTPQTRIIFTDMKHFVGMDYDQECRFRTEILTVEPEDLIHDAELLKHAYQDMICCAVGSKDKLDQCTDQNLTTLPTL